MKKNILILFFLVTAQILFAQDETPGSTEFKVTGKVKSEKSFSQEDWRLLREVELKNVNISCSPKKEDIAKVVKGVLVKDLLDSVKFDYENRKELNEYYFLFEATDGYRVVFSFNEIYNTSTGKNLYIVTEINGKKITESASGVLLLVTTDLKPGSRNVKWLERIVVCKAE